ncbi:MAG: hypothetical protein JRI66_12290 [Deltaproteobacteria bacterium]|nr:hypothetical protein [Deltaproteobacteria bacterium]
MAGEQESGEGGVRAAGGTTWSLGEIYFTGGLLLGVPLGIIIGWLACNYLRVKPLIELIKVLRKYCEIF